MAKENIFPQQASSWPSWWYMVVTYDEFYHHIIWSTLVPLTVYKITDYRTSWKYIYDDMVIWQWPVEPLFVTALSENTYHKIVKSELYNNDIIRWTHKPSIVWNIEIWWGNYTDWVLNDTWDEIHLDSFSNNTLYLGWHSPQQHDFIHFEASGTETTSWQVLSWVYDWFVRDTPSRMTITDEWGWDWSIHITSQSHWFDFLPNTWEFNIRFEINEVSFASTGLITRRVDNRWIDAYGDFRNITQRIYDTDIRFNGSNLFTWPLLPSTQWRLWTNIHCGIWGNTQISVVVPNTWDYQELPMVNAGSSNCTIWDPSQDPFTKPFGNCIFFGAIMNSNTALCEHSYFRWWVNDNVSLTGVKDSVFVNTVSDCDIVWDMEHNVFMDTISSLHIDVWAFVKETYASLQIQSLKITYWSLQFVWLLGDINNAIVWGVFDKCDLWQLYEWNIQWNYMHSNSKMQIRRSTVRTLWSLNNNSFLYIYNSDISLSWSWNINTILDGVSGTIQSLNNNNTLTLMWWHYQGNVISNTRILLQSYWLTSRFTNNKWPNTWNATIVAYNAHRVDNCNFNTTSTVTLLVYERIYNLTFSVGTYLHAQISISTKTIPAMPQFVVIDTKATDWTYWHMTVASDWATPTFTSLF